jgi:hypothetical protein
MARTDTAAAVAEVAAAEAAAVEAVAAAEAYADALGSQTALAPELPKVPGGGADGMAEDSEEIPVRPMFSVGAREELKTRGASLSSASGSKQSNPL